MTTITLDKDQYSSVPNIQGYQTDGTDLVGKRYFHFTFWSYTSEAQRRQMLDSIAYMEAQHGLKPGVTWPSDPREEGVRGHRYHFHVSAEVFEAITTN